MTLDEFNEAAESYIDEAGTANAVGALAEICRNRGNIEREDNGDKRAARLWTHHGAILFDAESQINRSAIAI